MEEGKRFSSMWLFVVWGLLVALSLAGNHPGSDKPRAGYANGRGRLVGALTVVSPSGASTTSPAAH